MSNNIFEFKTIIILDLNHYHPHLIIYSELITASFQTNYTH